MKYFYDCPLTIVSVHGKPWKEISGTKKILELRRFKSTTTERRWSQQSGVVSPQYSMQTDCCTLIGWDEVTWGDGSSWLAVVWEAGSSSQASSRKCHIFENLFRSSHSDSPYYYLWMRSNWGLMSLIEKAYWHNSIWHMIILLWSLKWTRPTLVIISQW